MNEKYKKLKSIEGEMQRKLDVVKKIQEINFPLESREFLPPEFREIVQLYDGDIKNLAKEYNLISRSLSPEEHRGYNFVNIEGYYYSETHQNNGLEYPDTYDEHSIHRCFYKAEDFAKKAIESLVEARKKGDQELVSKCSRIINECKKVFKTHYWGEGYIESLDRYEQRIISGRTVEDDLADYTDLVETTKNLSMEYATSILNGANEDEIRVFEYRYKEIFDKERLVMEFVPIEVKRDTQVNLHWLKVDAERNPQELIQRLNQENKGRKK